MRILVVSESYPPILSGVAVSCCRIAQAAAAAGMRVTVLTGIASEAQKNLEVIQPRRSVQNPFRLGQRVMVMSKWEVQAILDEYQPDVIHIHDVGQAATLIARIGAAQGIPVVATQHFVPRFLEQYVPEPMRPAVRKQINAQVARCYRSVIQAVAPTHYVATYLQELIPELPSTVISNGVDAPLFTEAIPKNEARALLHIPASSYLVGYAGRLDPDKDVPVLVRMLVDAPQVELVLIGGGSKREEVRTLARTLRVHDRLHLLDPYRSGDDRHRAFYQAIDLFAIPSPIETESIVTLEAMINSVPVLARQAGALPEVLGEGRGILVDSLDAKDWAHKTLALRAGTLTADLEAAKEYALSRTIAATTLRYVETYQRIGKTN